MSESRGRNRPIGDAGVDLGIEPLTARSLMLSTLLGTHPPSLPVRALVAVGELFGFASVCSLAVFASLIERFAVARQGLPSERNMV